MPCAGLKQIHTGIYSITQYLLKREKYRINWLHYKLKRKKKKKQQQGGGWAVEEEKKISYLWWIKALKKCILHIQWKLKLHQVCLVPLTRGKGEKIPLGGRRVKKKKSVHRWCVGGGATREDRKWHFERKVGEETAQHTTRREGAWPDKIRGQVKSEKEGLMLFFFYVHLRLIG